MNPQIERVGETEIYYNGQDSKLFVIRRGRDTEIWVEVYGSRYLYTPTRRDTPRAAWERAWGIFREWNKNQNP